MAASTTATVPSFTNLTSDKFVIVRNMTCGATTTNATLIVQKNTTGGDATFGFTGDNNLAPFNVTTASGTGSTTLHLAAGTYHITENAKSGWNQTGNTCATVALTAGATSTCVVTNIATTTTGTTTLGEIHGTKFEDKKNDWRRHDWDWRNRGLAGWTIYLDTNDNGILDAGEVSTITNWRGDYRFIGLTPGTYHVREVLQTGWTQVSPFSGKYDIVLGAGQISKRNNFVNAHLSAATISGMKYEDKNGNGRKNANEGGLGGWTIVLKKGGVTIATTVTAADGTYSFTNLTKGTYKLSEVMQSGWKQTDAPNPVHVKAGTISTQNDFGNTQKNMRGNNGHRNDRDWDDDEDEEDDD